MNQFVLQVCRGTSCHMRKSGQVLQALFDATGTSPEQPVSEDGLFEVQVVSCLEMCGEGPVVMVNGVPEKQIEYHNAIQQMGEETRLGIPITLSSDRQYNAWGGMIDTAHDAFGAANDLELATKLWTIYSLESRATGIHVVLHRLFSGAQLPVQ